MGNNIDFDEFLFASGNKKYWLRASKYDIIGDDGVKEYSNELIQIISSYINCGPSSGKNFITRLDPKSTLVLFFHVF